MNSTWITQMLIAKAAFEGFYKKDEQMFAVMMSELGEFIMQYPTEVQDRLREELLFSLERQADTGVNLIPEMDTEYKQILKVLLLCFLVLDKGDDAELIVTAESMLDTEIEYVPKDELDAAKRQYVTTRFNPRIQREG